MASSISASFTSGGSSRSAARMAEIPWGMEAVGMTMTFLSVSPAHCWAAMTIFLLLGSTITAAPADSSTARRISSVEGFMVCPPVTTRSAPSSWNRAVRPSPAQTDTMLSG